MEFKVDVKYNDHELGVEGKILSPHIPAVGPSFNDPGSPAEGGEIEITDIYMHHKNQTTGSEGSRRLPRVVVERYNHDMMFLEAVQEAIDEMGR